MIILPTSQNDLGIGRKFFRELKNGKFFSQKVLEQTYKTIAKWQIQELGDRRGLTYDRKDNKARLKLFYYQKALHGIVSYADLRSITLFDGGRGTISIQSKTYNLLDILKNDYGREFVKGNHKQFHMLFQLAKYLGFDPLTFTPLDDKDMATSKYRLHHFLAEMMRKMSSNVGDIVLTSEDLHGTYEKFKDSRAGEAYIRGLMKTIQDLIYMNSGQKIEPADVLDTLIKNIGYEKGSEVYQSWTSNPTKLKDFLQNLGTFNDRRTYALSSDPNKYCNFLKNEYKETWKNRNKNAIQYYYFIRKNWASKAAILFSYDADIDVMSSIYRFTGLSNWI